MLSKIWGESGWDFIHFVTLGYPENPTAEDRQRYYQYFTDLQYVLPCDKCRKNMADHIKQLPLDDQALSNRESLVKWGIDLHNIVNYYIGKPVLSYEQAMKYINDKIKEKESGKHQNNIWLYLVILLAIIIIIYLVFLLFIKKK